MSDALIHLRVPAALKARWVRAGRAESMRLTDWIIQRVEAAMPQVKINIPDGLPFAALQLARDPDGGVSFDHSVIAEVERASGLPAGFFVGQPEGALAGLIVQWYGAHIAAGGARDPVADDLISETRLEDERGGGVSHPPGRA